MASTGDEFFKIQRVFATWHQVNGIAIADQMCATDDLLLGKKQPRRKAITNRNEFDRFFDASLKHIRLPRSYQWG